MLKGILESKNFGFWIIIHALLGIGASFTSIIFGIWFFAFALSSLSYLNKGNSDERKVNLLYLISYLSSTELISRMGRGYYYKIPWELGKYTMLFGFLFGILVLQGRKGIVGFFMLFLLIPSLFFGPLSSQDTTQIVGNGFGPLALTVGVIFLFDLKIRQEQLVKVLKLVLLPCVSVLAFTLIRNPDFSEYEFSLSANFETSAGFGSNQVSTLLGLGAFITFLFWINNWELFRNKTMTLVLFMLFTIQGLLTFSRGGMIGALVGIIVVAYIYSRVSQKEIKYYQVKKVGGVVIYSGIALVALFSLANTITGGVLELRYSGETNATLRGTQEKDLNVLTTSRYEIFLSDLEIWQDHFLLGSGVASSKFIRADYNQELAGAAAHVELSRLLAEHGLLGLIFFILMLYLGWRVFVKNRGNPKYVATLLALYMIALYTTFHAATRTFVTPLLMGISLVKIIDIKAKDTI